MVALGIVHQSYDWDPKAAQRAFSKASELAPDNLFALEGQAAFLWFTGANCEALPIFERLISESPEDAGYFAWYADAMRPFDIDRAIRYWEQAIKVEPSYLLAYPFIIEHASVEVARTTLHKMEQVFGESYELWVGRIAFAYRSGDLATAEQLAQERPNDVLLAIVCINRDQPDLQQAFPAWLQAYEDRNELILLFVVRHHERLGIHDGFRELLQKPGIRDYVEAFRRNQPANQHCVLPDHKTLG